MAPLHWCSLWLWFEVVNPSLISDHYLLQKDFVTMAILQKFRTSFWQDCLWASMTCLRNQLAHTFEYPRVSMIFTELLALTPNDSTSSLIVMRLFSLINVSITVSRRWLTTSWPIAKIAFSRFFLSSFTYQFYLLTKKTDCLKFELQIAVNHALIFLRNL